MDARRMDLNQHRSPQWSSSKAVDLNALYFSLNREVNNLFTKA